VMEAPLGPSCGSSRKDHCGHGLSLENRVWQAQQCRGPVQGLSSWGHGLGAGAGFWRTGWVGRVQGILGAGNLGQATETALKRVMAHGFAVT
jgi:hypothetical protein